MSFPTYSAGARAALRAFAMRPLTLACLAALPYALPAAAQAQTPSDAATLAPVVITANPLGSDALTTPASVLEGQGLALRRASNLGETLNGLPGVSTTSYGPMVGRPIIRGLDGDRIRLLNNGVGMLDASSLSFDHAVPQDPLSMNRVEVLRGPAALLYGGNAIGGVVNTVDNRIPTEPIDGIHGEVGGSYGGANNDRNGAVQLEGGDGTFAIHADVFGRKTDTLRIPGYARTAQQRTADGPDADQPRGRLPNSDGEASGGALGMSWTSDHGYAGLSYSGYDANYGSVAEEDVRIKMHQERFGAAGELRDLDGPFKSIKLNFAYTDYQHKEVEDGETGTVFKNRGYEARIEARHADIGPLHGVLGLQFGQTRFSALGDEALVPTHRHRFRRALCARGMGPDRPVYAVGRRSYRSHAVDADSGRQRPFRRLLAPRLQRGQLFGGRHLQAGQPLVGRRQRRLYRARAHLLRALRQRPPRRHRTISGRRPEPGQGTRVVR